MAGAQSLISNSFYVSCGSLVGSSAASRVTRGAKPWGRERRAPSHPTHSVLRAMSLPALAGWVG